MWFIASGVHGTVPKHVTTTRGSKARTQDNRNRLLIHTLVHYVTTNFYPLDVTTVVYMITFHVW